MRVLARDGNGALLFDGKRFASVSGTEAKMQLLRERIALQTGTDRFALMRGVDVNTLKLANATPQAFASAVAQELAASNLVSNASAVPRSPSTATRPYVGKTVLVDARVVLRGDNEIVNLEVTLG